MKLITALFRLYASLWRYYSQPVVEYVPTKYERPDRSGVGLGVRQRLYDQEREDCTYHDADWEWPESNVVDKDDDIHDLNERFERIMEKMRQVPGIDPESVRLAYLGFDTTYSLYTGDVEAEYRAWLSTPEGAFTLYLAEKGLLNDADA